MERKVFESIAFGAQGSSILEKLKAVAAGKERKKKNRQIIIIILP